MIDIRSLAGLPDWLVVLGLASFPVVERFSIPIAYEALHMPVWSAYALSLVGNMIPVFLVYGFGSAWIDLVERRRGYLHRLTDWVLGRTRLHLDKRYAKYGLIAIPLLVAVPLPLTGAWTGALAAFIFGIPFKKALPLIGLGVFVSCTIIALAVSGAVQLFRIFL